MKYNWQKEDWTKFKYDENVLDNLLFDFAEKVGRISGFLKGLTAEAQIEAMIDMMVFEAIKTSEIEGEYFSRKDVMSSIRNNLGLNTNKEQITNKKSEGVTELIIDVRNSYKKGLTEQKLFSWHRMLMKGTKDIEIGAWRSHEDSMQVVSGAMGKEKIHFEAPPSKIVPSEMKQFIQWFNDTAPGGKREINKPVIRSAIAHLYFESIHPFEDGNGRIGRAISEKALSQGVKRPILLSLSQSIESNKKKYYDSLQKAQRSNDITNWLLYFVHMAIDAQNQAEEQIDFILKKTRFFDQFKNLLNQRQTKVIKRMLDEGIKGFEGGMNARKYIAIAQTSKATATRDLQNLVEKNVFIPSGGGRSIHYELNLF